MLFSYWFSPYWSTFTNGGFPGCQNQNPDWILICSYLKLPLYALSFLWTGVFAVIFKYSIASVRPKIHPSILLRPSTWSIFWAFTSQIKASRHNSLWHWLTLDCFSHHTVLHDKGQKMIKIMIMHRDDLQWLRGEMAEQWNSVGHLVATENGM